MLSLGEFGERRGLGYGERQCWTGRNLRHLAMHACTARGGNGKAQGCSGGGHWFTTLHAALGLRYFIEKTWPGCVPSLT